MKVNISNSTLGKIRDLWILLTIFCVLLAVVTAGWLVLVSDFSKIARMAGYLSQNQLHHWSKTFCCSCCVLGDSFGKIAHNDFGCEFHLLYVSWIETTHQTFITCLLVCWQWLSTFVSRNTHDFTRWRLHAHKHCAPCHPNWMIVDSLHCSLISLMNLASRFLPSDLWCSILPCFWHLVNDLEFATNKGHLIYVQ